MLGQPVRGVVLTEPLAGLRADDRLVEHLEHVVFDGGPVEPGQPAGQCPYEGLTAGDFEYPVEEVALHHPVQTGEVEVLPAEQGGGL